ncbi:fibronectin type-III domain-containing protein 3A-like isoform X1 [Lampetra fluviatilis]
MPRWVAMSEQHHRDGPSLLNGDVPMIPLIPAGDGSQQVIVVHVNPGETFTIRAKDGSVQCIQGPAQVPMMSPNGSIPPIHVPPGYVSQVIEDNGVRRVVVTPQSHEFHPHGHPSLPPPHMHPHYMHHPPAHLIPHPQHMYAQVAEVPPQYLAQPLPPQVYEPDSAGPHGRQSYAYRDERASKTHERLQKKLKERHHQGEWHSRERADTAGGSPVASPRKSQPASPDGSPSPTSSATATAVPGPPPLLLHNGHKGGGGGGSPSATSSGYSSSLSASPSSSGSGKRGAEECRSCGTQADERDAAGDFTMENKRLQEVLSEIEKPQVVEVLAREVQVSWQPLPGLNPEDDSGESQGQPSCLYELSLSTKAKEAKYRTVYRGEEPEFKLTELRPATEYYIRVCALCDGVKGSNSEHATFTTSPAAPEVPSPPKLTSRTKSMLVMQWKPPADNGSKVTGYVLEWDEGIKGGAFKNCYNGHQRQYRASKLSPSMAYHFRLAAKNDVGTSDLSDEAIFFTSGSIPPPPSAPCLHRAAVTWLAITWSRPTSLPVEESLQYLLEMDDPSTGYGFRPKYNGEELIYTIRNLRRSSEFKFRLFVSNVEGRSGPSEVATFETQPDKPGAPSKPLVKGKLLPHSFKVLWEPPKDNGGVEITNYTLELVEGDKMPSAWEEVYSGPQREHSCDHMRPGASYRLRVSCTSEGGTSQFSEVCSIQLPPIAPGPCNPPRVLGKPKARELHIRWSPPAMDGGCPVAEYTVELGGPNVEPREAFVGPELECTVQSLLPGRSYTLRVRAANKAGYGPYSEPVEMNTAAGVPEQCQPPTITCRSATLASVSWESPFNNGADVTEYRLDWGCEEGSLQHAYAGGSQSHELKGLSPATFYFCRVQAVNSAGAGHFSAVATACTPPSAPAAVSCVRVLQDGGDSGLAEYNAAAFCPSSCLAVAWDEPCSHGSEIVAYNVDFGERQPVATERAAARRHVIRNLAPDTTYRIRVQAVNAVGAGPFSQAVKAKTKPLPPEPPRLECSAYGPQSLKLKWGEGGASSRAAAADSVVYSLQMEDRAGCFTAVYTGSCHTFKVQRLSERTAYAFRIQATNEAGDGPFSETHTFRTTRLLPPAVKGLRVQQMDGNACEVLWEAVPPMRSDPVVYVLQLALLATARDADYKQVYKGPDTQHRLYGLHTGSEYRLRACAVRQCTEQQGAPPAAAHLSSTTTSSSSSSSSSSSCSWSSAATAATATSPSLSPGTGVTTRELIGPFGAAVTFHLQRPQSQALADVAAGHGGGGGGATAAGGAGGAAKALSDEQWAAIILVAFAGFSILIAVFIQHMVIM